MVRTLVLAQLANWTGYNANKFPTNQSGQIHGQARIVQMKFHPSNPNKYYAVTAQGGLFTSNNQGTSWTVSPGTDAIDKHFASIAIDYTNDQILYLGGGDPNYYGSGAGIYKSTDGGNTFTLLGGGLPNNRIVIEILMHPTDHNTIVAATSSGIYKSTDAGTTWTLKTSTGIPFCDMKSRPSAGSLVLYACTRTNSPDLYRSTDFGETWTIITSGITAPTVPNIQSGSRIAVTPADPNVVYFGMVSSGGMLFKSTDNGLNFTLMKAGGSPYLTYYTDSSTDSGQGNYNFCIGVDGVDPNKIWLQSHNTWYSSNGGVTWTQLTHWASKVHTDMHQVGKSPYDNTKLYSCNDGGVWVSTDEGNNWTPKSDGIFAFEIGSNAGKTSPTRRDFVNIGTQDNGELYADSTGWYTVRGGDWYANNAIDQRNNSSAVYFSENDERRIAPSGGSTTYNLPTTSWQAMAFNRSNINLAFMGQGDIYRSTDVLSAVPTWTQISNFNKTIKSIHSCIADPNRLYVLTSDQKIYISTNALSAAPTFNLVNLPTASNNTATVTAICNNADLVYIAINNKVYSSTNGGNTWTDITYNLPSVNHRRILSEEYYGTEELVFIATSNAVYYKKAGQTTWTIYSTGLPSRRSPTEMSIFDDGSNRGLLRWTSYGRGVWQTPFENLRPLRALFSASTSNPCVTNVFQFSNLSTGTPVSYSWSFAGGTPATSTAANPIVTFPSVGSYAVTLTVTDATSNTSTATATINITQLSPCNPDTIPGNALDLQTNTDFATIPALNISTNTITLSAWIKPSGIQSDYSGLIFSASNGATGLNLRANNQLGYHWNEEAGSYNYSGGPTVPADVWSHVALVVNATSATLYLNGVPYTRTATHNAVSFDRLFQLGRDRTNSGRNFIGKMDEVCIYNRALSTNEIRELMHLTKNYNTTDPSLIRYYQMNEANGVILEHTGTAYHASLQGDATRSTSTAPVGGGVSERQSVTTGGLKSFNTPGIEMQFPATGVYPNGDLVVFRLNVAPDQKPTLHTSPENGYWIVNNYGTNAVFSPLSSVKFKNIPNIATGYDVADFGMFKRSSFADGNTWGNVLDQADVFTPNGQYSSVTFSAGNNVSSFSQFTISSRYVNAGEDKVACIGAPNTIGIAGSTNFTYAWSPALGLSATNISNPVASPTVTTVYTVTATHTSSGETMSDAVTINVVPSALSVAPVAEVCSGGTVSLTANGGTGMAGGIAQLGNGTSITQGSSSTSTLGPNPLQNWFGGSKQLMLFTASELNGMGLTAGASISALGFNLANANTSYVLTNFQVKVQNTTLSTLSTFVTTGWTVVRPAADYTPAIGWNTIGFNSNYTWNGTSNLLIEINYSNANTGSSGNTAYFGATLNSSTLLYRADNVTAAAVDGYTGAPTYTYQARNNVQFTYSNPSTYTWSPATGLNTTTGISVDATPVNSTTYTVTATTMGCSTTASVPVPVFAASMSVTSGCGSSTLTALGGVSYLWSSGETTQSVTLTSSGTRSVTVTNAAGCTASTTQTVQVSASPTASITAPSSICAGESVTLTASNGVAYTWSTGETSSAITLNPTATNTYQVTVSFGACSATAAQTVSINANPVASISGATSVCPNGTVTLTASGASNYLWSTGETSASITVTPSSSNTTYSVTVSNANNCRDNTSQSITLLDATTILGSAQQLALCENSPLNLAVAATGTGTLGFAWSHNGQPLASSINTYTDASLSTADAGTYEVTVTGTCGTVSATVATLTINSAINTTESGTICQGDTYAFNGQTYTAAGTYTATLTRVNGCDSIVTLTLNVNPLPNPSITQSGAVLSTGNFNTYQWYYNGSALGNATSQSYTPTLNGNYSVGVSDANGCMASSNIFNVTDVSTQTIINLRLELYPNPTTGVLYIKGAEVESAELFSLDGRLILSEQSSNTLNLSSLPSGMYVVRIRTSLGTGISRVVKE